MFSPCSFEFRRNYLYYEYPLVSVCQFVHGGRNNLEPLHEGSGAGSCGIQLSYVKLIYHNVNPRVKKFKKWDAPRPLAAVFLSASLTSGFRMPGFPLRRRAGWLTNWQPEGPLARLNSAHANENSMRVAGRKNQQRVNSL